MEARQEISKSSILIQLKRKNPTLIASSSSVIPNIIEINSDSEGSNVNNSDGLVKRPKSERVCDDPNLDDANAAAAADLMVHDQEVNVALQALPLNFLDPRPPSEWKLFGASCSNAAPRVIDVTAVASTSALPSARTRRQFWKAGDYEASNVHGAHASTYSNKAGMDHVRVHPRFLHSNATSHKWALGAFAELLDNALDEVCNGATHVNVDMIINQKGNGKLLLSDTDRNRLLVVQDNGGGMDPDKMRGCMSLGYSAKSIMANTIGQYGNGFKTSTMRLGADAIVFSICQGKDGASTTRSIGMLSYTFLTKTGKEDIVVPMIDYEDIGHFWIKMLRSSLDDWNTNLDTIIEWSPFSSELELLQQFNSIGKQGTRIVIYNLWEDDEGQLELDFGTDPNDIQIRGVNRDQKKISMARLYPNSKHYLTYQHSLRSYASILYLRLPPGFRIILRGKDVVHHNLVNDMMLPKQISYRPVPIKAITDGTALSENMQALVTLGFVKDARSHIDVQGFNVYHKNRLIKPFWRVWSPAGSGGRGVIGVLEANFVEPAHDKQGFERTTALSRLESRLVHLQKHYWRDNCCHVGYSYRRPGDKVASTMISPPSNQGNVSSTNGMTSNRNDDSNAETNRDGMRNSAEDSEQASQFVESLNSEDETISDHFESPLPRNQSHSPASNEINGNQRTSPEINADVVMLREENLQLQRRLKVARDSTIKAVLELHEEKDKNKSLEAKLKEANEKIANADTKYADLNAKFAGEIQLRDIRETNHSRRIQEASDLIETLRHKVVELKAMKIPGCKPEID